MVGHLTLPHYLSFSKEDDHSLTHPHNNSLHIEVMIGQKHVRRVLIDNGASLNICSASFLTQLGYGDDCIDTRKKITIKAYDEEERRSKGLVVLPIHVGPIEHDVVCQVLDISLTYNILLGHTWIHEMQAVPSTYHQCIKFPFHGSEVTVPANTSYDCNMLTKSADSFVLANRESIEFYDAKLHTMEKNLKLNDTGMGGYQMKLVLSITSLPLSPCSYGKPLENMRPSSLTPRNIYDGAFV